MISAAASMFQALSRASNCVLVPGGRVTTAARIWTHHYAGPDCAPVPHAWCWPRQVWHYRDTDPDFGQWQAKELLDHMEGRPV